MVVVDMDTGSVRRLLQGHVSTLPEDRPITVDGKILTVPGKDGKAVVIKVGTDGIAADKNFEWLYFGPLNGTTLYRVRIADLNNQALSDTDLGARPQDRVAVKPHASPVLHALLCIFGRQSREKHENFRGWKGARSYPSRAAGRSAAFHRVGLACGM